MHVRRDVRRLAGGLLSGGDAMSAPADEAMRLACDVMDDHLVIHVEHGVDPWISGNPEALAAALASLESSGWVCVPREMTAEMRDLVGKVEGATRAIQDRRCWTTALAAAPRLTGEKR